MKVLGIDPGLNITGYGIIEQVNDKLYALDWGKIKSPISLPFTKRLKNIHEGIEEIIDKHKPAFCAVEDIFVAKNPKSALKLGHARCASILAAARNNIHVEEYTALEVKQSIVGYGRADKTQVRDMISFILNIKKDLKPLDIYDALAVAVCHIHSWKHKSFKEQTL